MMFPMLASQRVITLANSCLVLWTECPLVTVAHEA